LRLLVLGGTSFVGRAAVEDALARGWQVTTFSRGISGTTLPGVTAVKGDRTVPGDIAALASGTWDVVLDTWRGGAEEVLHSTKLLSDLAGWYCFVSSLAVYDGDNPCPIEECARLVPAVQHGEAGEYALAKVLGERAVEQHFGNRGLVARAGLVLGPYEYAGRLPWWLLRLRAGGETIAPGPAGRPVQYIDCRDLAGWVLDCAVRGVGGVYNVVCDRQHATMANLLNAAKHEVSSSARLVWVDEDFLLEHQVGPWDELPIWVPTSGRLAQVYNVSNAAAVRAGLRCRPVTDTVSATWDWLAALDDEQIRTAAGQYKPWLSAAKEREILAAWNSMAS
jgi:2'-hydroxyisoflavone reductase